MARLQYQHSVRTRCDRDEVLEDRSWSITKLVGFIIACISLLILAGYIGACNATGASAKQEETRPIIIQAPAPPAPIINVPSVPGPTINIPSAIKVEAKVDADVRMKSDDPPRIKSMWDLPQNR
jgi:hypothetical protein